MVDSTPHWDGNQTVCIPILGSPSKLEEPVVSAQPMEVSEVVAPVAVGPSHILGSHDSLPSEVEEATKGEAGHLVKGLERRT